MNQLPTHRSALLGRTQRECWDPRSYDPIEKPARRIGEQLASAALAVAIGIGIAVSLVAWWSS